MTCHPPFQNHENERQDLSYNQPHANKNQQTAKEDKTDKYNIYTLHQMIWPKVPCSYLILNQVAFFVDCQMSKKEEEKNDDYEEETQMKLKKICEKPILTMSKFLQL